MKVDTWKGVSALRVIAIAVVMAAVLMAPSPVPAAGDAARGQYVFTAAGCGNCHTDPGAKGENSRPKGEPLAGGRPLKTPFGAFYTPNITPHPDAGIGRWTLADFRRALREGRAPNGMPYYPSFPYTSYTGMTDRDIEDLWAYLKAQPASERPNRAHDLGFPFNLRILMHGWRLLFFEEGRTAATDPERSEKWNRGAYLVRSLAHCGECHTPRNSLGAMERSRELAGNDLGPGAGKIPDLTPHDGKGAATWSERDIVEYLKSGMTPESDFAGGEMAEVIDHSTSKLTPEDREAIAVFIRSLKPVPR